MVIFSKHAQSKVKIINYFSIFFLIFIILALMNSSYQNLILILSYQFKIWLEYFSLPSYSVSLQKYTLSEPPIYLDLFLLSISKEQTQAILQVMAVMKATLEYYS